jgi:hypothetical protein
MISASVGGLVPRRLHRSSDEISHPKSVATLLGDFIVDKVAVNAALFADTTLAIAAASAAMSTAMLLDCSTLPRTWSLMRASNWSVQRKNV